MYLCNVVLYGHTNIVIYIQAKKAMNKIQIAAELLRERAEHTTDATAFIVKANEESIDLIPDADCRGGDDLETFFHMDTVVSVCYPLHLSFWITAKTYVNESGDILPTFKVHIY